jgi:adenylyltransferase/sulfurtransferase
MMSSSADDRYSRQVRFVAIGPEGQARIRAARVLVAGCGGLGTVSAGLLARAGVGLLRIVDRDVVELSNLQRQALFTEDDVERAVPKAIAAARHLAAINRDVVIDPVIADVGSDNVLALLDGIDLVVDGFDNFEARYLLNDACVSRLIPWVYGACVGAEGLAALIVPGKTPCLRCLFEQPPEPGFAQTCDTAGIIGPIPHVVAALQVAAGLRFLVEGSASGATTLVSVEAWQQRVRADEVCYRPTEQPCPCCVGRRFEFLHAPLPPAAALCGRDTVLVRPTRPMAPDLHAVAEKLAGIGEVLVNQHLLRLRIPSHDLTLWADGRIMVRGTTDVSKARSLVARHFGM